jgi:hypothetical protein
MRVLCLSAAYCLDIVCRQLSPATDKGGANRSLKLRASRLQASSLLTPARSTITSPLQSVSCPAQRDLGTPLRGSPETGLQSRKGGLSQDTADCCDHHVTQDIGAECFSLAARTHELGQIRTSYARLWQNSERALASLCWAAGRLVPSAWSFGHGLCCGALKTFVATIHRAVS